VCRRDWACRAALPLFQPNSNHLLKAKEGKKTRCLPKRDHPQTQERQKREANEANGGLSVACDTTALLFFFLFFYPARALVFIFYFAARLFI
jgi:hypothetical protein